MKTERQILNQLRTSQVIMWKVCEDIETTFLRILSWMREGRAEEMQEMRQRELTTKESAGGKKVSRLLDIDRYVASIIRVGACTERECVERECVQSLWECVQTMKDEG